jgi:diguanylate cyclase (GGDEF)-like protein
VKNKLLDSIVKITNQRDSDALGTSIVATIGELLPGCVTLLYQVDHIPRFNFEMLASLSTKIDNGGVKHYLWGAEGRTGEIKNMSRYVKRFERLTMYTSDDKHYHIYIPILNDKEVIYALDISSSSDLSSYLDTLLVISKVCENFYVILSSSERDPLTGLFNRSTFENRLSSLLTRQHVRQLAKKKLGNKRCIDHIDHTWLAVIDIDFFKRVNDQFGHVYGDEVLLVLSQLLKNSFRSNDLIFRFGGEEFVIIFEPIEKDQAELALNKLMNTIRNKEFPMVGRITISCGYAKVTKQDHPKTILDNADKALYYAKEHGRDCLYNYEDLLGLGKVNAVIEEGDIELF